VGLFLQKTPENFPDYIGYRVAKTHKMPYIYRSFSTKETYKKWLFQVVLFLKKIPENLSGNIGYKVAKTHKMPCLHRLFSAKETYN